MGKNVIKAAQGLLSLPVSLWQCLKILKTRCADLVIGVGGYTSPMMVLAAALIGIARVILEPNAYPGMANKAVGPFAQLLPCGQLIPKVVPGFCTVDHGRLIDCPDPHPLFDAADRVTARRGEEFTATHRAVYKGLFDRGANLRRTVVHEAELRRLRRG